MSVIDEYEGTRSDVEQATAYYNNAQKCINDGNCQEVLVAGAEYAGVDPATAQLIYDCAKNRDTDTCIERDSSGNVIWETMVMNDEWKAYLDTQKVLKDQQYRAFAKALEWRMQGLTDSVMGATGEQISRTASRRDTVSNGWLIGAGLIGAGALAYVYRKKIFSYAL